MAVKFIKSTSIPKMQKGGSSPKEPQDKSYIDSSKEDFIEGSGTFDYKGAIKAISKDSSLTSGQQRRLISKLKKAKDVRSEEKVEVIKEDGELKWRWESKEADSGREGGVQDEARSKVGFGGKGFLGFSGKDFDRAYDYMVRNGFVEGTAKYAKPVKESTETSEAKEIVKNPDTSTVDSTKVVDNVVKSDRKDRVQTDRKKSPSSKETADVKSKQSTSNIADATDDWADNAFSDSEANKRANENYHKANDPFNRTKEEKAKDVALIRKKYPLITAILEKDYDTDNSELVRKERTKVFHNPTFSPGEGLEAISSFAKKFKDHVTTVPKSEEYVKNEYSKKLEKVREQLLNNFKQERNNLINQDLTNWSKGDYSLDDVEKMMQDNPDFTSEDLEKMMAGRLNPKQKMSLGGILSAVNTLAPITMQAVQDVSDINKMKKGDNGLDTERLTTLPKINHNDPYQEGFVPQVDVKSGDDLLKKKSNPGGINSAPKGGFNTATEASFNNGFSELSKNISLRPVIDYLTTKPLTVDAPKKPLRRYIPRSVEPTRGLSRDQIEKAKADFAEAAGNNSASSANPATQVALAISKDKAAANLTANLNAQDLQERGISKRVQNRQEQINADNKARTENFNVGVDYENKLQEAKQKLMSKQLKQQRDSNLVRGLYSDSMKTKQASSDMAMMQDRLSYGTELKAKADAYSAAADLHGVDSPEAIQALEEYNGLRDTFQARASERASELRNSGNLKGFLSSLFN